MEQSYAVAEQSKKRSQKKLSFPWRYVDDAHVNAEGFEPKQYGFEIDQKRVLDLLTGHTLYNDSAVVLRELAQNAIDAVRLQADEDAEDPKRSGRVLVRWDSNKDELEIVDNGTGMTQEIIEKHLLKVGSSRYQDDKFRESHPKFSPISRFGIGVLSAFMIADEVEFVTCSPTEEKARQISLRSVHGKYLIRLLEKDDNLVKRISPHGTSVRLKLRPSAKRIDVLKTARQWVIVPACQFQVQVDAQKAVRVGFDSPKEALRSYVARLERSSDKRYRIEEKVVDGLYVAYALVHNNYFDEWTFVAAPSRRESPDGSPAVAMCVEGIAVEFRSPGFTHGGILALANATGQGAPKTNVARSSLEETEEKTKIIETTYGIYVSQLHDEMGRMLEEEKYPLSRVINQLPFLADNLDWRDRATNTGDRWEVSHPQSLRRSFSTLPLFLLEDGQGRAAASLDDLTRRGGFWTVESALTSSLENLISHMPVDVTARGVLTFAKSEVPQLPEGALISNLNSSLAKASIAGIFEIIRIRGIEEGHRLEIEWAPATDRWISSDDIERRLRQMDFREGGAIIDHFSSRRGIIRRGRFASESRQEFKIPIKRIAVEGLDNFAAVSALGTLHFLAKKPWVQQWGTDAICGDFNKAASAYASLKVAISLLGRTQKSGSDIESFLEKSRRSLVSQGLDQYLLIDDLRAYLAELGWDQFNPFAWSRAAGGGWPEWGEI